MDTEVTQSATATPHTLIPLLSLHEIISEIAVYSSEIYALLQQFKVR